MSFDIEQVLKDMAAVITGTTKEGSGNIQSEIQKILDDKKDTLRELSAARLSGEIDDEVFNRELEREKKVVEAQLLTIEIMTKALAQKAVNAAIEVFTNAVKVAI